MALDATKRPGFLTRVAFLSTFSHFDATSPILRGAFITGRVLAVPTGTPNPAFLDMKPPAADYTTNREATEALTAPATCAACHAQKVNPPGFVLERYDAVGGWQDTDPLGGAINSTADITFDGTKFQKISAPADLMTGIAASPNAQRFYAGMWVNFAAGRPSTLNDACVVDNWPPTSRHPHVLDRQHDGRLRQIRLLPPANPWELKGNQTMKTFNRRVILRGLGGAAVAAPFLPSSRRA